MLWTASLGAMAIWMAISPLVIAAVYFTLAPVLPAAGLRAGDVSLLSVATPGMDDASQLEKRDILEWKSLLQQRDERGARSDGKTSTVWQFTSGVSL